MQSIEYLPNSGFHPKNVFASEPKSLGPSLSASKLAKNQPEELLFHHESARYVLLSVVYALALLNNNCRGSFWAILYIYWLTFIASAIQKRVHDY